MINKPAICMFFRDLKQRRLTWWHLLDPDLHTILLTFKHIKTYLKLKKSTDV